MGVLLMVMTIGGLVVASILLVASLIGKKTWLRNFVLGGMAVWSVFYTAMLFGFSLFSNEKILALNEPKEYCGFYLDCHLHTAVTEVHSTRRLGDRTAKGRFYIINVRVFSDAVKADLALHSVNARVVDEQGRWHERDRAAE